MAIGCTCCPLLLSVLLTIGRNQTTALVQFQRQLLHPRSKNFKPDSSRMPSQPRQQQRLPLLLVLCWAACAGYGWRESLQLGAYPALWACPLRTALRNKASSRTERVSTARQQHCCSNSMDTQTELPAPMLAASCYCIYVVTAEAVKSLNKRLLELLGQQQQQIVAVPGVRVYPPSSQGTHASVFPSSCRSMRP